MKLINFCKENMKLRKILKIKKSINSRVPLTYTWFTQVGHTHYLRIIRERHLKKGTRARDVNEKNKNKSNVKTRVPLTYTWFTQANDRTYYKRGHQLTYSSARNLSEKWILEKIMNSWALGTYEKYARPENENVFEGYLLVHLWADKNSLSSNFFCKLSLLVCILH